MPTKKNKLTNYLDHSYLQLPEQFYSLSKPEAFPNPQMLLWNEELNETLDLPKLSAAEWENTFSGHESAVYESSFSQAYAGHQFGHFTLLGDGRAVVLGEGKNPSGEAFDLQLKGSGQTPYSRRGDGKATLGAMLREYLMSEAVHHLGIPSSRTLAVVKTGEQVYRQKPEAGALLARVMSSHIRVGTFQFARVYGSEQAQKALLDYTINRHFKFLKNSENKALGLLKAVMESQVDLIVAWMRVGFIHGVMNTDNIAISGETFDYGPCAFMNVYHPDTVFSSIDRGGRYAFGQQPKILKWNLARLAEALLPQIHEDEEKAIELAVEQINAFDVLYKDKWFEMMARKLGFQKMEEGDHALVKSWLALLKEEKLDYTNAFLYLQDDERFPPNRKAFEALGDWKAKWQKRVARQEGGSEAATQIMQKVNPLVVARNIYVESAIEKAEEGDFGEFRDFLKVLSKPYTYQENYQKWMTFDASYDAAYQTFCGT